MGNSTLCVQDIIDAIASRGNVNPQANPSGYNLTACLSIANDVMDDMIAKRFNFKWNSALAKPFLTNPYQQDYPQLGLSTIGWLEAAWSIDINSTTRPLPQGPPMQVDRDLDFSSYQGGQPPLAVAWMYNRQLSTGRWPGVAIVYQNPVGQPAGTANPSPTAISDPSGNILVLTSYGTTAATGTGPDAGTAAVPLATVQDGTCVWTVADPNGQGFRLDQPAAGGGRTWQVNVKFQNRAVQFTSLEQTIDPIPDDYAHRFRRGYNTFAHDYSPDPKAQAAFPALRQAWLAEMDEATAQGDREPDAFRLVPATQVIDGGWGIRRDPRNPGTPY